MIGERFAVDFYDKTRRAYSWRSSAFRMES